MNPLDRLISILESRSIRAGMMPWTGALAVCFTECPWPSLIAHAANYSPFGVGFDKAKVFVSGGGPVYYVRPDHWKSQHWNEQIRFLVTPFLPRYRPPPMKKTLKGVLCDFTHEREWRLPNDMNFEYQDIELVLVGSYADMESISEDLKNKVGKEKFIILNQYEKVESLWPIHKI